MMGQVLSGKDSDHEESKPRGESDRIHGNPRGHGNERPTKAVWEDFQAIQKAIKLEDRQESKQEPAAVSTDGTISGCESIPDDDIAHGPSSLTFNGLDESIKQEIDHYEYTQEWLNKHDLVPRIVEDCEKEVNRLCDESVEKRSKKSSQDSGTQSAVTSSLSSWDSPLLGTLTGLDVSKTVPRTAPVIDSTTRIVTKPDCRRITALPSFSELTSSLIQRKESSSQQVSSTTPTLGCVGQLCSCGCGLRASHPSREDFKPRAVLKLGDGTELSLSLVPDSGISAACGPQSAASSQSATGSRNEAKSSRKRKVSETLTSGSRTATALSSNDTLWTDAPSSRPVWSQNTFSRADPKEGDSKRALSRSRGPSVDCTRSKKKRAPSPLKIAFPCDECGSQYSNVNNLQRHVSKSGHKSELVKLCKCPFTNCSLLFKDNAVFQKHFQKVHLEPLPMIDLPSDNQESSQLQVSNQPVRELESIKELPSSEEHQDVERIESIKELQSMAGYESTGENQSPVQPFQWPEEFLPQGHQHEMEEVVVTTSAEDIGSDGIKILTKLDQKPIEQAVRSKRKSLAPKVGRIEVGAGDTSSQEIFRSQGVYNPSQGIRHSKGAISSLGVCNSSLETIFHSRAVLEVPAHDLVEDIPSESERSLIL